MNPIRWWVEVKAGIDNVSSGDLLCMKIAIQFIQLLYQSYLKKHSEALVHALKCRYGDQR